MSPGTSRVATREGSSRTVSREESGTGPQQAQVGGMEDVSPALRDEGAPGRQKKGAALHLE